MSASGIAIGYSPPLPVEFESRVALCYAFIHPRQTKYQLKRIDGSDLAINLSAFVEMDRALSNRPYWIRMVASVAPSLAQVVVVVDHCK